MQFPHRVLRRLAEESVGSDLRVNGVGYGHPRAFDVQLSPTQAEAAYRDFGVELSRPHFLCWPGPGADFPVGSLLQTVENRLFIVSAPPRVYDFGNASDHCDSVADELQYEPSSVEWTGGDFAGFDFMGVSAGGSIGGPGGDPV